MNFKMNPGRGNMPKTGRGLSPALMCGSPMKQEDPKKKEGPKTEAVKASIAKKDVEGYNAAEVSSAEKLANKTPGTGFIPGTNINKATGQVEAKKFEKTFVEASKDNAFTASIRDSKGNVVKSVKAESVAGKYNPTGGKTVQKLRDEFGKTKSDTEDSRMANSVYQTNKVNKLAGGYKK
jgi:hypothetical protein